MFDSQKCKHSRQEVRIGGLDYQAIQICLVCDKVLYKWPVRRKKRRSGS